MAYNETEQNRLESIEALSKLAINGMMLGMAYIGLKPMLMGEPSAAHGGVSGYIEDTAFPIADYLNWPLVALIICGGALAWYMTKRIPKKVTQRAYHRGVMEVTDWQDVSREDRFAEPKRRQSAY